MERMSEEREGVRRVVSTVVPVHRLLLWTISYDRR
jgi:hypothetical protein